MFRFILCFLFISIDTFAQPGISLLRPGSFGEDPPVRSSNLIENLTGFQSAIDWSKGDLVTEYSVPITHNDPNIGRSVINTSSRLKDDLLSYAVQALGQVTVSSYFSLGDYFTRNEPIRNALLESLYDLSVEDAVVVKSRMQGRLRFPLYGSNSVSEPFYRNIKSTIITNYLMRSPLENYYDTLIIDLVMFPAFTPSLMPRILNQQGQVVHSVETVDPAILRSQGPVHYATSITEALNHPARGRNVAYIFPADIGGAKLADITLFDSDVQRLFSQQRSVNSFRAGKIILIHSGQ